jgi:hypothetical protein
VDHFCNDCVIVAACLVATGRNLELMLEQPRIVRDGVSNSLLVWSSVHTSVNSVTPKGRIFQMLKALVDTYFETTQYVSP